MGQGGSKPEDLVKIAQSSVAYSPPLGAPNPANPKVYFDIKLGRYGDAVPLGRIVMEVKEDVVPNTAKNFVELAKADKVGAGFIGSAFHRIIPGFMCQGGDFTSGDGRGGRSIYGARFADENFDLRHTGPGVLSMANAGPNTNGSQFFLCVAPTAWLDGKHVVFGQVIDGYGVVKAIEACGSRSGQPSTDVIIAGCGVLEDGGPASSAAAAKPAGPTAALAAPAAAPAAAGALQRSAAPSRLAAQWRVALKGRQLPAARVRAQPRAASAGLRIPTARVAFV